MEKYIGDLELDNGDVVAVVLKNGYLIAGGVTNTGIMEDYKMKYDEDYDMDVNLQNFAEYIGEHPIVRDSARTHSHSAHRVIERGSIKGSERDAKRPTAKEFKIKTSAIKRHSTRDSLKRTHKKIALRKHITKDSLRRVARKHSTRDSFTRTHRNAVIVRRGHR